MNRDRYLAAINEASNIYSKKWWAVLDSMDKNAYRDNTSSSAYQRLIDEAKAERDRAYIAALETELGDKT